VVPNCPTSTPSPLICGIHNIAGCVLSWKICSGENFGPGSFFFRKNYSVSEQFFRKKWTGLENFVPLNICCHRTLMNDFTTDDRATGYYCMQGDVFENELLKLSFRIFQMDIGAILLACS